MSLGIGQAPSSTDACDMDIDLSNFHKRSYQDQKHVLLLALIASLCSASV